jgi:hypothetical protein
VAIAEVFSPRCMENDPSFREFETSLDGITVSMVVVAQRDGQALRDAAMRGGACPITPSSVSARKPSSFSCRVAQQDVRLNDRRGA